MSNASIVIETVYDAPVAKVWKALTDHGEMKKWYFDMAAFKPEIGFEFQFICGRPDGEQYIHLCKVTEAVQNKKIAYSWTYKGYAGYSIVMFELFAEGAKTRLKLTHEGLESFPADNPDFDKKNYEEGWTYITGKTLKEFVGQVSA